MFFRIIIIFFLIFVISACSKNNDKNSAFEEMRIRNIDYDLSGLKKSTVKIESDGAYVFGRAGFFEIISNSDFNELVKHAGKTNNHGLISALLSLDKDIMLEPKALHHYVYLAIDKGHIRTLKLLFRYGATLKPGSLIKAVYADDYGLVKFILDKNSDFDTAEYKAALVTAARIGHLEAIKSIVDSKKAPRSTIENAILGAALREEMEVIKYLVEQGVDINFRARDNCTPLHSIAQDGTIEMIKYMITVGANINAECRKGETPLKWAYYGKNEKVIAYLEDNNALIN